MFGRVLFFSIVAILSATGHIALTATDLRAQEPVRLSLPLSVPGPEQPGIPMPQMQPSPEDLAQTAQDRLRTAEMKAVDRCGNDRACLYDINLVIHMHHVNIVQCIEYVTRSDQLLKEAADLQSSGVTIRPIARRTINQWTSLNNQVCPHIMAAAIDATIKNLNDIEP